MYLPNEGAFSDVRVLAELAADADAAGWDGFFIWDALLPVYEHSDAIRNVSADGARPAPEEMEAYAAAGVTWVLVQPITVEDARERIRAHRA